MNVNESRRIEQVVDGRRTSDGGGVSLLRVLGGPAMQRRLDPYLLFDHFGSYDPDEYIAGFPNHPHRGIETITLMHKGQMRHKDSRGGEGLLANGGVQWMTAGQGIIHSEMPEQEEGVMEGFQLWLNLPANKKMTDPWYQDFQEKDIPGYMTPEGVYVRVIAGRSGDVVAYEREVTEPFYIEITMPARSEFRHIISEKHNAFIYVLRGAVDVKGQRVAAKQMGILSPPKEGGANGIIMKALNNGDDKPIQLLLITGKPLNEPIVQYGPFAMNTKDEIIQAIEDYKAGRLR